MFSFKRNSLSGEKVKPIDWQPTWSTGAPLPQVISNGSYLFLIYLIDKPNPDWDNSFPEMINPKSKNEYPLALVKFDGSTFRFGIANDEVFGGLPLYNKGMNGYGA